VSESLRDGEQEQSQGRENLLPHIVERCGLADRGSLFCGRNARGRDSLAKRLGEIMGHR
jgi:hypothetical protein